jgi:hypothetical protein
MTATPEAETRARDALTRLDRAAARVLCPDLVLYRGARAEARRRAEPLVEHAPGVPAVDPAEQPPIAAVLRGEEWLAGGRPGGWRGLACDLHWELMQGRDPAAGTLRSHPSWLGGRDLAHARRRFPEPRTVSERLAALGRALRADRDPFLAAANAHARLALLHPFRDGNGRVAQALVAVVLRERGLLSRPCLLLGGVLHARKRACFAALDRLWSGDRGPWVSFFLGAIERAATDTAAACEAIRERFEADERRLPKGGARRLLWRLSAGALPLRDIPRDQQDGLRALREARIARVVPGVFDGPIVLHVGLARIVAGGGRGGRVSWPR